MLEFYSELTQFLIWENINFWVINFQWMFISCLILIEHLKSKKVKTLRSWKHMNLLDGTMDDLAERIDERLKDVTGMQRAEDSTP